MNKLMAFFRLWEMELMKVFISKRNTIIFTLLVLIIVGAGAYYRYKQPNESNWKEALQSQIAQLQNQQNQLKEDMEKNKYEGQIGQLIQEGYNKNQSQLNMLNYAISKNIPYNVTTQWSFVKSALSFSGIFIIIYMILIGADAVALEFTTGTITLLLIRPHKRWKILLSKYITIFAGGIFAILLAFIVAFLTGIIFFGFTGISSPNLYTTNGVVSENSMVWQSVMLYGAQLVKGIVVGVIAFMISTIFKSSKWAISIAVMTVFIGPAIFAFFEKYNWSKYILFGNMDLTKYLPGNEVAMSGLTLPFSITVLCVYVIAFSSLAFFIFDRRDVLG